MTATERRWVKRGFVAVIVGFFFIVGFDVAMRRRREARERARVRDVQVARSRALAALKERDPGFQERAFAERARKVMAAVNAAWIAGDMRPARALVSDGVFVRFQSQLALLARDGLRNVMHEAQAVSGAVVAAESDALWDTVHVELRGRARDVTVPADLPLEEAKQRAREAPLQDYTEIWSFLRRRGAAAVTGVPALDGKCARCGATVALAETVRCGHCHALLNSGEHDWVLAEVTQEVEWDARHAAAVVPGLDAIRARDPAVSRQALEDRASVIFWKWIAARTSGDRRDLDRYCLSAGAPAATPSALRNVAVGACTLEDATTGEDGRDRVRVRVVWSAAMGTHVENRTDVFTLARAASARSSGGLTALDCATCGGDLAESDDPTCRYCGTALGGGHHEWALEAIVRAA